MPSLSEWIGGPKPKWATCAATVRAMPEDGKTCLIGLAGCTLHSCAALYGQDAGNAASNRQLVGRMLCALLVNPRCCKQLLSTATMDCQSALVSCARALVVCGQALLETDDCLETS